METDCFSKETLQEYLSGTSHDDPAEIEHHLVGCPKCEETLRQLEGSPDAFVAPLRQHSTELPHSEQDFQKALEASKRLISPSVPDAPLHRDLPMELGSYTLLEPLGHGGMGSVYLAFHQTLKKSVAIKILQATSYVRWRRSNDLIVRFWRQVS